MQEAKRGTIENPSSVLGASSRENESLVRPISQVVLKIPKNVNSSAFGNTRKAILEWIDRRAGRPLPEEAWKGESFTVREIGAQPVEVIAIEGYWAARFDDADKEVAQRVWTTEISIAEINDGSVLFGTRLHCVTRGEDRPFDPSIPRFVRDIISVQDAYLDERMVSIEPWIVDSDEDVDRLCLLLTNPHRHSEVIVFSTTNDSGGPDQMIDMASRVAKQIAGVAHTVILKPRASWKLSGQVGEEFSVYGQAVRTYRLGFDPSVETRFAHPLVLASRIAEWESREGRGWVAYEKFLISQALRRSISGRDIEQHLPRFATVRHLITEKLLQRVQRNTGLSYKEQLAQEREYTEKLEKALKEQEQDFEKQRQDDDAVVVMAEDEREQALKDREQALEESHQRKAQYWRLQNRIKDLEKKLNEVGHSTRPEIPNNFDDFERWCGENLSGFVEVHKRAFRGIKDSLYGDPSLIFKALLVLRDYYVPMRQRREGDDNLKKRFEEECQELGIMEAPSIDKSRQGEEGDTYCVKYLDETRFMDRHLKNKGNSRDPSRCFRLYFFWDDENGQVVVGWLPSHLSTRIT